MLFKSVKSLKWFNTKSCKLSYVRTLMVEEKAKCGFVDGNIHRNYYNL